MYGRRGTGARVRRGAHGLGHKGRCAPAGKRGDPRDAMGAQCALQDVLDTLLLRV
jgi:hypothetical protein